jgi:hypothetical protein
VILPAAAAATLGCSADPRDRALADIVAALEEVADVLEGCTDAASARAAEPRLRALAGRLRELVAAADALGAPDQPQWQALRDRYRPRFGNARHRLSFQESRVRNNPETAEVLAPVLEEFRLPPQAGP